MRVLVADDHPMYRAGLVLLFDSDPRTRCVGQAGTGAEAVELALQLRPDVVVMDLHLPDLDGVAATRRILGEVPDLGVLMLTMSDDDQAVMAALNAGARGYLLKEAGAGEIISAVLSVGSGASVFGPATAARITALLATGEPAAGSFPQLTARERDILEQVARGHTNQAIARELFLSQKTVRNYVSNLLVKLQVRTRSEAIVLAREAGLGLSEPSRPRARG